MMARSLNAQAQDALVELYLQCSLLERSALGGLGPLYDAWEDVWATTPEIDDEHLSAWELAMEPA